MTLLAAAIIWATTLVGCGGEDKGSVGGKGGAEGDKPVAAADEKVGQKEEAPDDEKGEPEKETGDAFAGTVTFAGDAGAAQEAPLKLSIAKDGAITGALSSKDGELSVRGMLDGETVRCWVAGGVGDEAKVRRGTLVGKAAGGGYEGTISISDNGASSVVSGTWKTSK